MTDTKRPSAGEILAMRIHLKHFDPFAPQGSQYFTDWCSWEGEGKCLKCQAWDIFQSTLAALDAAEAKSERLLQEAQIQAQEMRTMKSIVNECYQAASDATGEAGNWNGSKPVVECISKLREQVARLEEQDVPMLHTHFAIDLYRQWFDTLQDTNPAFLEPNDYRLAIALYKATHHHVPQSIIDGAQITEQDND